MVAAAIVTAAGVGAVATNIASKRAGGDLAAASRQGRQDIIKAYGQAPKFVTQGADRGIAALNRGNAAAQAQYAPYTKAGNLATNKLESLLGLKGGSASILKALQSSPGYKFALQQGDQATINAASAGGFGVNSGNTLEALSKYNQGLATDTYQNAVANLENLAGIGFNASTLAAGADLSTAGGVSNIDVGSGTTLADLYSQRGTALGNVDIGQGTNQANIDAAQGASEAGIAQNAMGDFLLMNMMKSGGTTDYYDSSISRWKHVRN